jgi:hypothetical protein
MAGWPIPGWANAATESTAILPMVVMLGLHRFWPPATGKGPKNQTEDDESEHDQGGDTHESSHDERTGSTWIDACRKVASPRCARPVLSTSPGGGPLRAEENPNRRRSSVMTVEVHAAGVWSGTATVLLPPRPHQEQHTNTSPRPADTEDHQRARTSPTGTRSRVSTRGRVGCSRGTSGAEIGECLQ